MKNFYFTLIALFMLVHLTFGQDYLTPSNGYKAELVFPGYSTLGPFDLFDTLLYANDGDTIHCLNLNNGVEEKKFGKPAGYVSYASFITMSPDGKQIWAGYTSIGNTDDRVYSIDVETGAWELQAMLPGNFDLEFWNDSLLVSGLNSPDWSDPGSIFVLDTSGRNQHRKIVITGGYSAGVAVDQEGNLYYGTSYPADPNAIFRWDSADIANVLGNPEASALIIGDGVKLTDLPGGANDCEVDAGGNLVFNFNDFMSDKVLARWNGTAGEGQNFDTLSVAAEASDWLGMVKSQGDITLASTDNRVFTVAYGRPITEVHLDYIPVLTGTIQPLSGLETAGNTSLDLTIYFTDPDDEDNFTFEVISNSDPAVVVPSISGDLLVVDFLLAGQSNVVVRATNAGKGIDRMIVVGVQPVITGNHLVADFEDLSLDPESYWNGADNSGGFSTGITHFYNDYNADWFSWSGWAYSNISDNTTSGYLNQYSAITGSGFDETSSDGSNYGVGYVFTSPVVDFLDSKARKLAGFFVTNSTYAALSMEHGDAFTKKFGGEQGSDPDYFMLMVWGRANGSSTDTIEFYLADYRFEDHTKDYIIKTWQWVDLGSLGKVDSLMFALASTDVEDWGMNTPGYFCMDNLHVIPDEAPVVVNLLADVIVYHANASDTVINLSNVFTDPDDDDASITKNVHSNSNDALLGVSISGNELTLSYAATSDIGGVAEIVIEGVSGGLAVTDTFKVTVIPATGLTNTSALSMEIYPNPNGGKFMIRTNALDAVAVKVFSLTGAVIFENRHQTPGEVIDISSQPAGSYIIRIIDDQEVTSKLIHKQ